MDAAYEPQSTAKVPEDFATALDKHPRAKAFFETQVERDEDRYAIIYRIGNAKNAKTGRAARIEKFISMLEFGQTVHPPINQIGSETCLVSSGGSSLPIQA